MYKFLAALILNVYTCIYKLAFKNCIAISNERVLLNVSNAFEIQKHSTAGFSNVVSSRVNIWSLCKMDHVHPLLLQNIVANVFKYFDDLTELKKCRMVCRTWNEESCLSIRKLYMVEFSTLKSLQSYNSIFQLSHFLPHANYKFNFCSESSTGKNVSTEISMFLSNFGEQVKACTLPVKTANFDVKFLDLMISYFPNLCHLGLDIHYYQQNGPVSLSPLAILNLNAVSCLTLNVQGFIITEDSARYILTELFCYLPNLRRLSCPGDLRRINKTGNFLRDLLLEDESVAGKLTMLTGWRFKTRLLQDHCDRLLKTDFHLTTFYADLYDPDENDQCASAEQMANLMKKWRHNLTILELEFPFRVALSSQFHFPVQMEFLKSLYLGGFEGSLLHLLKMSPRLNVLELSQLDLAKILPKPEENEVYKNVNKLTLDFCTGQSAGIVSRFSRVFPCIEVFSINHATNQVLRVVFQKMEGLKHLCLHGDEVSDAGICGFSERDLQDMNFLKISSLDGCKHKKYPHIGHLKALKFLNLNAFNLTEISIRHGLVHCKSLHLVKMDCTGGGTSNRDNKTISRTFRLSEYAQHMVEETNLPTSTLQIKEEPPLEKETLEFFESHKKFSSDLL